MSVGLLGRGRGGGCPPVSQVSDAGEEGGSVGLSRAQIDTLDSSRWELKPCLPPTHVARVWGGRLLGRNEPLWPREATTPAPCRHLLRPNRPGWRGGSLPGTRHLASPDLMESIQHLLHFSLCGLAIPLHSTWGNNSWIQVGAAREVTLLDHSLWPIRQPDLT